MNEQSFKALTRSEQADHILAELYNNNINKVMLYLKWSGMTMADFQ